MKVMHSIYGEGTVKSLNEKYIEVDYSGELHKHQFPKIFESFLTTDDLDLQNKVSAAIEKAGEVAKQAQQASIKQQKEQIPYKRTTKTLSFTTDKSVHSPLLGDRARTISVRSEAEMFEIVGYIASPGRVSSFEAEVPRDGRDETFERLFPDQKYRPIEMGETPSGMPNKLSPQFRINFANLRNCPEILLKNMGKGNGPSCVGRINKSRFVIDLVQNYGFRFGNVQDISGIRAIAERRGFLTEFERGYKM